VHQFAHSVFSLVEAAPAKARGSSSAPTDWGAAARRILFVLVLEAMVLPAACRSEADAPSPVPTSQTVAAHPITRTAEQGPLKVTVTADRDRVEIPEQLTLTIHIEAEAGIEVTVPKLEGAFGDFGVAASKENEPDCPQYARCKEWIYTLDSFLPGNRQIPALTFSFRDPREKADGSKDVYEDTVKTDPIEIKVTQALADVKGPVKLPMPFRYKLLWWALGAVLAMVLIAMAVRWWRRRANAGDAVPTATRVPPHVWALEQLDKLAAEDLIHRGRIQEYYYRINGLLRRYIEMRFGLMAGEQTSEEFLRALGQSPILDQDHKAMLHEFVQACDPVKYAKYRPEPEEIAWVQTSARDFVVQTAPETAGPRASASPRNMAREEAAV